MEQELGVVDSFDASVADPDNLVVEAGSEAEAAWARVSPAWGCEEPCEVGRSGRASKWVQAQTRMGTAEAYHCGRAAAVVVVAYSLVVWEVDSGN